MNTVKINSNDVKMIAHRGLSGLERENTCAAFIAAGKRSYFGIETDVRIAKDSKFVIIHDETTKRVSLGKYDINVEKNDYSAIKNIILPDLDGTTGSKDLRIPLLNEYIEICRKYNKICVLELKNHLKKRHLDKMIKEIYKTGYINNVIFISFDYKNCINIRKILPNSKIQWLIGKKEVTDKIIKKLQKYKLDIDIYYKQLNEENISLLHSKGIKVNCWTCDDKTDAEKLVSYGVDFITTNILE